MKKKILVLVSVLLCMVILAGCGQAASDDYNGMTKDELKNSAQAMITQLQSMSPEQLDEAEAYYVEATESGEDSTAKMYAELIGDWKGIQSTIGEFKEFGEFTVAKTGKSLTTTQVMKYSGRDARFVTVYSVLHMKPTAMNAEIIYTTGELMGRAGLNVAMGMGIVFSVLILISIFIAAFNIFPYLEQKKAEKNATAAAEEQTTAPATSAAPAAAAEDDLELVAVITAAIAMQTGASTDSFVVRSIRRRA
jgi:sodium pump decarboxylase gamma subunit